MSVYVLKSLVDSIYKALRPHGLHMKFLWIHDSVLAGHASIAPEMDTVRLQAACRCHLSLRGESQKLLLAATVLQQEKSSGGGRNLT